MVHDSFGFYLLEKGRQSDGKNVRHCAGQITASVSVLCRPRRERWSF